MVQPPSEGLSDASINKILAALPPDCRPKRVALLRKILRDWSAHDLPVYGAEPCEWVQNRIRQHEYIRSLGQQAHKFLTTLATLENKLSKTITLAVEIRRQLLDRITLSAPFLSRLETFVSSDGQLSDELPEGVALLNNTAEERRNVVEDWLAGLAELYADWGHAGKRGRPRATRSRMVMEDVEAFWMYVSDTAPRRMVRGEDHPNYGQEYGPFWDFARTIWVAIFCSERGLSSAMRTWARERAKRGAPHEEAQGSLVLALVALRHPEWRIFAP